MSANRLNLKSKPLIAVVVVLLAVVTVANVRTFGGKKSGPTPRSEVRVQASPPYPSDLADVVRSANRPLAAAIQQQPDMRELERDPFRFGPDEESVVVANETVAGDSMSGLVIEPDTLRCDAVFPGGSNPAALSRGEARHIGDVVDGYLVRSIDTERVSLSSPGEPDHFLAAATNSDEKGTSNLIVRLPVAGQGGRTRLIKNGFSERKKP